MDQETLTISIDGQRDIYLFALCLILILVICGSCRVCRLYTI